MELFHVIRPDDPKLMQAYASWASASNCPWVAGCLDGPSARAY